MSAIGGVRGGGSAGAVAVAHLQPLAGVVETDWLPFPFTMNWLFTQPGRVRFEKPGKMRWDYAAPNGKVIVSALTTWAMIDRASGRLARVRDEVTAPFRPFGDEG